MYLLSVTFVLIKMLLIDFISYRNELEITSGFLMGNTDGYVWCTTDCSAVARDSV